eukprot:scaffold14676_cov66-Phaeocystis_antarctica.AAC.1
MHTAHLAVRLIPRHAGGGDASAALEPERERRCFLRVAAGGRVAVGSRGGRPPGHQDQAFCRGEAWAVATLEDGTLAEPACSALWRSIGTVATFRLEVLFFFAGYWQAIAVSAAAAGGGRSAQEEERLMLEGLVALSCGTARPWSRSLQWGRVGVSACTCWTRTGRATAAGRRRSSPDDGCRRLRSSWRRRSGTTRTTRRGSSRSWGTTAPISGRLRLSTEWRPRPLRTRSICGTRLSARARSNSLSTSCENRLVRRAVRVGRGRRRLSSDIVERVERSHRPREHEQHEARQRLCSWQRHVGRRCAAPVSGLVNTACGSRTIRPHPHRCALSCVSPASQGRHR